MARVTIAEVREILSTEENAAVTDDQVTAAITTANILVNRVQTASCHTTESLKELERYTAAAIVTDTTAGGEITEEKIGDASEKRNRSSGTQNSYWLTAYQLDCSGQMKEFGKSSIVFQPFGGASD